MSDGNTAVAPVRLGAGRVTVAGDAEAAARRAFAERAYVPLPGLLDQGFMDLARRHLPTCTFEREVIPGLGEREIEAPQRLAGAILLLLRHPDFLAWVGRVTGAGAGLSVGGTLVRSWPGGSDRLEWHDDTASVDRVAGLTIRMGSDPFIGGEFEIRRKARTAAVESFRHAEPGDGLLFAVDPAIEHRVLPLAEGGPRCVFTGWFTAPGLAARQTSQT